MYISNMAIRTCCRAFKELNICKNVLPVVCPARKSNTLPNAVIERHRFSRLNRSSRKEDYKVEDYESVPWSPEFLEAYADFLPSKSYFHRDRVRGIVERNDMLLRRRQINIPLFFPGSFLAVTFSDKHSPSKESRFVGICIERYSEGLRSTFIVRNVIDNEGIEIQFDLYSPLLLKIEVLKLEKRLDPHLRYLRDAPLEYSYVPFDIHPSPYPGKDVPVNPIKVKLNPRPWKERWERTELEGIDIVRPKPDDYPRIRQKRRFILSQQKNVRDKFDVMSHLRNSVSDLDAKNIIKQAIQAEKKLK